MSMTSKLMRLSGELCREGMTEDLVIESNWIWSKLNEEMLALRRYDSPIGFEGPIKIFGLGPDVIVKTKKS